MRRLILSPLIFLAALVSCEKDTPLGEAIIGKWDVVSVSQVTYKDNIKKNESTIYLDTNEMAIQFAAGGTGIYYENNDVYGTFSWTLTGSTVSIPGETTISWDITIDKDTLVWTYSQTETTDSATYKYEYFYTAKRSV
jgi:hypothetical protein